MKSKSKKKRIVRYRKPMNINVGLIIFILIFFYIGISCIIYLSRDKISIYEVVKGESENIPGITATGIALRTEQITNAPSTGYVNYYVKDGTRVSVGETIYTIDESGSFSELLKEAALNDATLTSDNISEIKDDITSFISTFDAKNFETAYEFKYDLNSTLIECVNLNSLDAINQTLVANGNNTLSLNTSNASGIIEFYTDGMEQLTPEGLNDEIFNKSDYKKTIIERDKPTEAGSAIYKTITDEKWRVAIPLTDEQVNNYTGIDVVDILFPSENISTSAYFSIVNNGNSHYGIIELSRYMVRFADKRYIDIQIIGSTQAGLKIPKSSIAEKDFYTVPIEYLTTGGNSNSEGFMKEVIGDDGTATALFTAVEVVERDETLCYVDSNSIESGAIILQPESTNKYKIESTSKLTGVYNVNTGLATFRHVKILSEKNGYYIVESGTKYGLQVYDQIVLNAKLVKENQIIFK